MSGLDIYSSCGDVDLMSKQTPKGHNVEKEFFHFETRQSLSAQDLIDK